MYSIVKCPLQLPMNVQSLKENIMSVILLYGFEGTNSPLSHYDLLFIMLTLIGINGLQYMLRF